MARLWSFRTLERKLKKLSHNKTRIATKLQMRLLASNTTGLKSRLMMAALQSMVPASRILPMAEYADQSKSVATLAAETDYVSEPPRLVGQSPDQHSGKFPAITARLFSEVEVAATSSAILTKTRICVPPLYMNRPDLLIADGTFLRTHQNGIGVADCPKPNGVPNGIAVFGAGVLNWYHWLIEILPSAYLAEGLPVDFETFPLLVPEAAFKHETFRASLSLFTNNRRVTTLEASIPAKIGQLILIDSVARGPMNLTDGCWPGPKDYSQNSAVLGSYRAAILERLSLKPGAPTKRIFLARDNTRRNYNQQELLVIAEAYGFEAVYPERLSFREQVAIFASAEMVVGPSGAAFANMLFCQQDTRGLTWLLPQYNGFCAYSNLAKVMGMDLRCLFVTPHTKVTNSFDAYSAAYTLSATEFESALKALL